MACVKKRESEEEFGRQGSGKSCLQLMFDRGGEGRNFD